MAEPEFSEAGRKLRFEQWEKLGLDRIKSDLQADPYRRIGSGAVQNLAWEWVRMKEAESTRQQNVQVSALELLALFEQATRGSAKPAVLWNLQNLGMSESEAKEAFLYLKDKRLLEANFSITYSARLSGAGHDALAEVEAALKKIEQSTSAPEKRQVEVLTLKPSLWGMSIDLKEAARRLNRLWKKG